MDKTITSRGGIKLKTAKKYVTEDITVTPVLQNKVITENNVTCVADEGYAGLSSVKVNVSAGADLSVEYSLTPPQSAQGKLWIKGTKPEKTIYTADVVATAVSYSDGSVTMPKTFYNVAAAAVGSKIYVFGSASDLKNGVAVYDTDSGLVEEKAVAFGNGLSGGRAVAVGNTIYVASGADGYLYSYAVQTNEWTKLVKWNVGTNAALFRDGNYIYAIGGTYGSSASKEIKRYDVTNNSYETIANLPVKITKACVALVGRNAYVFGGLIDSSRTDKIYKFNLDTRTSEQLTALLPTAVEDFKACVCGSSVYLTGGYLNTQKIYLFDCATESVSAALEDVFYSSHAQSVGVQIGDRLYRLGGGTTSSNAVNTTGVLRTSIALENGNVLVVLRADGYPVRLLEGKNQIFVNVKRVFAGNANDLAMPCEAYYCDGSKWINVDSGAEYSA